MSVPPAYHTPSPGPAWRPDLEAELARLVEALELVLDAEAALTAPRRGRDHAAGVTRDRSTAGVTDVANAELGAAVVAIEARIVEIRVELGEVGGPSSHVEDPRERYESWRG